MFKYGNTDWVKIDKSNDCHLHPVPGSSWSGYWDEAGISFGVQPAGSGLPLMMVRFSSWEAWRAGEVAGSADCCGTWRSDAG